MKTAGGQDFSELTGRRWPANEETTRRHPFAPNPTSRRFIQYPAETTTKVVSSQTDWSSHPVHQQMTDRRQPAQAVPRGARSAHHVLIERSGRKMSLLTRIRAGRTTSACPKTQRRESVLVIGHRRGWARLFCWGVRMVCRSVRKVCRRVRLACQRPLR